MITATLDRDLPHLYFETTTKLLELFKHVPHEEGWVVLVWNKTGTEDMECAEAHEFHSDLEAALVKFTQLVSNL